MQDPSPYDARKRREVFAVELRTRARSDQLYKRRLGPGTVPLGTLLVSKALGAAKPVLVDTGSSLELKLTALKEVLAGNSSSLKADALKCLAGVVHYEQAADTMCSNSTVPLLKEALDSQHDYIVQDCTSVLVGLTSGQIRVNSYLMSQGVVEALLRCISSHNALAALNAVWALANMLIDIAEVATLLLNKSALNTLQNLLEWYPSDVDVWRGAVFCLRCVCHDRMAITEARLAGNLVKRILSVEDADILRDAIAAVERLVNGDALQIESVLDATVIEWLIKGLKSQDQSTRRSSLTALTSVTATSPDTIQHLLSYNLLDGLKLCLRSSDPRERVLVLMCLGNIAYETSSLTSQLMAHSVMHEAVDTLMDTSEVVRDESLTFLENLALTLSFDQRLKLIYVHDIFRSLSHAFGVSTNHTLSRLVSLSTLLIEAAEAEFSRPGAGSPVKAMFESSGCLDELNRIAVRASNEVYKEVFDFIDFFFSEPDDSAFDVPVAGERFSFS